MGEDGKIISVNPQLCSIFGYSKKELLHQSVGIICDSPHDLHHDEYVQQYLRTGGRLHQHVLSLILFDQPEIHVLHRVRNLTGKHKDGTPIVISLEVTETEQKGKRVFVGKMKEITEEMEALITIDINGYCQNLPLP